jgi:haloalkane dehalogenase
VHGVFRTPEDRFDGLWSEPVYANVDGLRIARHDEGDGPAVVFFHGEPTWSYLWRKVISPVRDAGYRCIAPDLAGFGRSNKPTAIDWYSYDRHVASAP